MIVYEYESQEEDNSRLVEHDAISKITNLAELIDILLTAKHDEQTQLTVRGKKF